ncbi:hypothetical protein VTN31DRAFT_5637 [Thermomyces dupontii]|uniref:uncharacterized protein n=1 Tax=Talaromyces thermophilus TaxID=28565 RepID=UPI0037441925
MPLFFGFRKPFAALIDILLLTGMVLGLTWNYSHIDTVAAWLLVPYAAWLGYAAYLNYGTGYLNQWDISDNTVEKRKGKNGPKRIMTVEGISSRCMQYISIYSRVQATRTFNVSCLCGVAEAIAVLTSVDHLMNRSHSLSTFLTLLFVIPLSLAFRLSDDVHKLRSLPPTWMGK